MGPEQTITGNKPWGFPKGGFRKGGDLSIIGVVRAPDAIINFAFFLRGFLIESYINSKIFTQT